MQRYVYLYNGYWDAIGLHFGKVNDNSGKHSGNSPMSFSKMYYVAKAGHSSLNINDVACTNLL